MKVKLSECPEWLETIKSGGAIYVPEGTTLVIDALLPPHQIFTAVETRKLEWWGEEEDKE
jgi:hypothetical protein